MDPIASFSELDRVEGRHVVVSTFIADQRHKSSVRWLFDAYEWLHNRSGHHWHIVVPVQYPPTGRNLQFGDYNYDLAEQLRNSMGVSQETLPCFVFDNFIEEEKQYGVKLPLDDNDRAKLIETVADFVNSRIEALVKSGGSPSRKTRKQTTGQLVQKFKNKQHKEWAVFVAAHGLMHLPAMGIPLAEHFIKAMSH